MPSNVRSNLLRDHLPCFFDMSMRDALVVTGCSRSTLRKFCRTQGVEHWPFELIKLGLRGAGHTWDSVQAARDEALATFVQGAEHDVLVSAGRVARVRRSLYEGRKDLLLARPSQAERLLSEAEDVRSRSEALLRRAKPPLRAAKLPAKRARNVKRKFTSKRQAKCIEACQNAAAAEKTAELCQEVAKGAEDKPPAAAKVEKEEGPALGHGTVAYEYFARMCGGRFVCQQESVPLTPPSSPGEVDDGAFDFFDEHAAAREHLYPAAVDDVLFR
jgi:hypothetical protein